MFKRVISLLLCLALILPMVPVPTRATEPATPETVVTSPTGSAPETTAPAEETTTPIETTQAESATAHPAAATSASGACGDSLTWILEDGTLTIEGAGAMDSYAWSADAAPWSSCSEEITTVVIGNEVTSIGGDAFSDLVNLTEVSFPSSVRSIGDYAFSGCTSLTALSIPIGVQRIGARAFYGCTGLKTIDLPVSLTGIDYDCFRDCTSLTGIVLPGSVESLGDQLFWNCTSLTTAEFQSGISSVPEDTFQNCTSLTAVTLPSSVRSIAPGAFYNCTSLESITIPNRVTSLAAVFQNCSSLTQITIPALVTDISGAFSGCTSLTSVSVPKRVTNMAGAFSGCTNLVTTNIPDGATDISNAFSGCTSLTELDVPATVTNLEGAFSGCVNLTGSITVPSGTTEITDTTFQNCQKLTGISLPDTVTTIAPNAFENCKSLTQITIPNGVTCLEDEVFAGCTNLKKVVLPDTLTVIGHSAFYECSALTEINFPGSLTELGDSSFAYTNLESAAIPESVTVIEDDTFMECKNLTAVTLPEGITSIGFQAFSGCERLSSINIPQSVRNIDAGAFNACSSLTEVTLPEGITTIGRDDNSTSVYFAGVFDGCTSLVNVSLPDSLEELNPFAFSDCTSLQSILLPANLKSLPAWAFGNCTGLTEIVIPDMVTRIDIAFVGCTNLKTVVIPASVTTIEEGAFQSCPLTDVYYTGTEAQWDALVEANKNVHVNMLPDGLQNLWDANIHCNFVPGPSAPSGTCGENLTWTFENGTLTISGSGDMAYYDSPQAFPWHQYRAEITALSLPEGLTSISYDAFFSCTQLTSVTLPGTLTAIGGNAFSWSGLTGTVSIPASVTNIGTGAFQSCNSLTGFAVAEANPQYRAIDGVLFSKDGTTLHTYPSGAPAANYSAPAGTTTLENASFMGCHNLTGISLPEGLTTIYGSSFYCDNLTGLLLPASLSYVGHYAFLTVPVLSTVFYTGTQEQWQYLAENGVMDGNQSLLATMVHYNWTRPDAPEAPLGGTCGQNLTWQLENGTLTISGTGPMEGYPWRQYASQITALSIGYGVTSISYDAFANLNGITEVVIPETVIAIGAQAFQGLQGLTRVEIQGPTLLESCAFDSCSQLKTLILSKEIPSVAGRAFGYCDSLTDVYFTGTEAEWSDFLQNRVETGNDALKNAPNVVCNYGAVVDPTEPTIPTEPTAPTEPTQPEDEPLLAQGTCGDSAAWALTTSGRLTISGTGAVTSAPWREGHAAQITAVTVSDGITALCDAAFLDCANVKKVTLPASVTAIGASAFYGCTVLTSAGPLGSGADYEFGWTKEIPANAFLYLKSLTKITFPKGLTTIGEAAFVECGLTKLVIPEGVKTIGEEAFVDCVNLKRLSLPSTLTSVGNYAFYNCMGLTDVFIMSKKITIGENAFNACSTISHALYAVSEGNKSAVKLLAGNQSLANAECVHYGWKDAMTTRVLVKRYGVWYDALEDNQVLALQSPEVVDLCIVVGMDVPENSTYRLEQNGIYVLSSSTGIFHDLRNAKLLTKDETLHAVVMDRFGNALFRKQLSLRVKNTFTLTWQIYFPDTQTTDSLQETFVSGADISDWDRTLEAYGTGYRFAGWYTSPTRHGLEFFSDANNANRQQIINDIILYDNWEPISINDTRDIWSFSNDPAIFDGNYDPKTKKIKAKYEITDSDFNKLIESLASDEDGIARIKDDRKRTWSGSCFGLSSLIVLAKTGDLDISNFPEKDGTRYDNIYSAQVTQNTKASKVGTIESLINFYQLRQNASLLEEIQFDYNENNPSPNLRRIIQKMESVNEPIVLGIKLHKGDGSSSWHAVVAYDLEQYGSEYSFQIYDCSIGPNDRYTVTVFNNAGTYSATYPKWEEDWSDTYSNGISLIAAWTAEDLKLLPILEKPNTLDRTVSSTSHINTRYYCLRTSYTDFIISDGTKTATITNGRKTTGDLSVVCNGITSVFGTYRFELPILADSEYYTITQSGSGTTETTVQYSDPQKGFFLAHEADAAGTIRIGADGSIVSQYDSAVAQTVDVTHNGTTTPWYITTAEGTTTGITMISSSDAVQISAAEETTLSITTGTAFNETLLPSVSVGPEAISVEEGENVSCIITQNGETIASSVFGHSVVFDSQYGTAVDTLTNIPTGTLIPAPADPTKTGYLFEGWFTDKEYTDRWDFATDTVTADLVLYAGWSVDPDYMKSLTFRVPGQPDQIVYLPVGSPIPADYAPLGPDGEALSWFTDSACTEPWDFETGTLTRNLILYGQTPLCTVTFVTGIAETLDEISLRAGYTIPQPVLTREGHTLCGWYTDEACTTLWDFEADTISANMTLYARWLENEVDKNGQDTGIAIEILNPEAIVYTGKPLKPQIVVRDGGKILVEGRDFTLTYRNNTNAADICDDRIKSNKLPQVTIQGKGNYKSTKKITKYFTILPADLADLDITLPAQIATKSGNKNQTLKATVSTGLAKAPVSAYTIHYFTDVDLTQEVSGITVPGLYYVTLQAKTVGNYTGISDTFLVEAAPSTKLLSSAKITTGKSLTALDTQPEESAAIGILLSKVVLDKTTFLTDPENIAAFLAHFVVTATDTDGTEIPQTELGKLLTGPGKKTLHLAAKPGNEAGFVGTKDISIQIKGPALNKKQFLVTFDRSAKKPLLKTDFTGSSQIPAVISDLVEGTDYIVSYKQGKNAISADQITNAGTYTLVITGKNGYSGTLSYNFSINKADLAKLYAAGRLRIVSTGSAVYDPNGAFPHYSLSYAAEGGRISLENGVDYTLTYSGNKTVTEKASATIKGKGNFTGSLPVKKAEELRFSVTPKPITASDISVSVTGITIQKNVVKSVKFALSHNGKTIAAAQYKGTFTDNGDTLTLTVTAAGKLYTGTRTIELRKDLIKANDGKQVKIILPKDVKYYYTGSEIQPDVTITDSEGRDISHCFVISCSKNRDVGSASVTVTGRPDMGYCGSKTVKFTILPRWLQWLLE